MFIILVVTKSIMVKTTQNLLVNYFSKDVFAIFSVIFEEKAWLESSKI